MIFCGEGGCTTTRIEALNTDEPLILGSPHIRCWFDEALLARTQSDLLRIQDAVLAKLQRLNTRALEALQASEEHGEGGAE